MSGEVAVAGKVIARSLTLLLAGAALACDDGPLEELLGPLEDPSVISVSISIDRDSTRPGEVLHVTVTATNPTSRRVTVEVEGWSCGGLLDFVVRSGDGAIVGGSDMGCFPPMVPLHASTGRTVRLEFAPGQSVQAQYDWTAERLSWTAERGLVSKAVGSGVYEIVGFLNVQGGPTSDVILVKVLPVLTLTIDIEPAVPAPGDTVTITATMTNESDKRVTIPDLGSCRFGVWVGRAGSGVAYLTDCPLEERQLALFPHRSTWRVLRWQAGEPGDYVIVAHLAGTVQPDLLITRPLLVR